MRWKTCALALAGSAMLFSGPGVADETRTAKFAAPVLVKAGGKNAGEGRYYPSPVLRDMNGDGKLDLVIADLVGHVTVAHATDRGFGPEQPLMGKDGKRLKFDNW